MSNKAFIVQSLDDNFNVRRVERFMVQIMEEISALYWFLIKPI